MRPHLRDTDMEIERPQGQGGFKRRGSPFGGQDKEDLSGGAALLGGTCRNWPLLREDAGKLEEMTSMNR
jgi:hypothetical protein